MTRRGVHSPLAFLRLEGAGTLTDRVFRAIRAGIIDGRLAAGQPVPSSRQLAADLGVSRKVVASAYGHLIDEGYLEGRHGAGTFVTTAVPDPRPLRAAPVEKESAAPRLRPSRYAARVVELAPWPPPGSRGDAPPLPLDFRYGVPALADFPQRIWSRLVSRRGQRMSLRSLGYGRTLGLPALREAVADYLARARGVTTAAEQIVIVNGSQQALDLLARLLVDAGDRVVCEEPGYQGARQVFQAAGAEIVPIGVDARGLRVQGLPADRRTRLAYVTPSHQFPLGGVLPLERRLELLHWASASGAYLIEDDYDSEFRYEGRPVAAMQGLDRSGRVIYVGTFSKVLCPAMRLAYMVVPPGLAASIGALKFLIDYHTPTFEQEVLADFLVEGHFERHLRRCRRRNAARRDALLDAAARDLGDRVEIVGASAGVHAVMWLRQYHHSQIAAIADEARQHGVGLYPVTPYYMRPPARAGLLLGYACLDEDDISRGIAVLARSLDKVRPAASRRRPRSARPNAAIVRAR
jgi:GntR family transcriptional regulator/MocR family aminotransferase